MAKEWYEEKIAIWAKEGAFTKDSIMARMDGQIRSSYAIEVHEKCAVDELWKTLPDGVLTRKKFVEIASEKARPHCDEGRIMMIYDSLKYLSTLPFPSKEASKAEDGITKQELIRALAWALPDRTKYIMEEGPDTFQRTEADHHRAIFQSFAIQVRKTEHDVSESPQSSRRDEYGDDIYHDLLGVLYSTQEVKHPGLSTVPREALRVTAKKIGEENNLVSLRELAIPKYRFELLTTLMLCLQFQDSGLDPSSPEMISAARALSTSFSEGESKTLIYWPQFCRAIQDTPHLLEPYYRLLFTMFYNKRATGTVLSASERPRKPETPVNILTIDLLSQLSTNIAHTAYFGWLFPVFRFKLSVEKLNPSRLVSMLKSVPAEAILVITGKSDGKRYTYGWFSPNPKKDEHAIADTPANNETAQPALLFQLQPTHGVFKGVVGKPAWEITEQYDMNEGVFSFGREKEGMMLALKDGLRRAVVANNPGTRSSYESSKWRGEFKLEFYVEYLEVWSTREPQE